MRNEEQITRLKLMIEHVRAMSERLQQLCDRMERHVRLLESYQDTALIEPPISLSNHNK